MTSHTHAKLERDKHSMSSVFLYKSMAKLLLFMYIAVVLVLLYNCQIMYYLQGNAWCASVGTLERGNFVVFNVKRLLGAFGWLCLRAAPDDASIRHQITHPQTNRSMESWPGAALVYLLPSPGAYCSFRHHPCCEMLPSITD